MIDIATLLVHTPERCSDNHQMIFSEITYQNSEPVDFEITKPMNDKFQLNSKMCVLELAMSNEEHETLFTQLDSSLMSQMMNVLNATYDEHVTKQDILEFYQPSIFQSKMKIRVVLDTDGLPSSTIHINNQFQLKDNLYFDKQFKDYKVTYKVRLNRVVYRKNKFYPEYTLLHITIHEMPVHNQRQHLDKNALTFLSTEKIERYREKRKTYLEKIDRQIDELDSTLLSIEGRLRYLKEKKDLLKQEDSQMESSPGKFIIDYQTDDEYLEEVIEEEEYENEKSIFCVKK